MAGLSLFLINLIQAEPFGLQSAVWLFYLQHWLRQRSRKAGDHLLLKIEMFVSSLIIKLLKT